MSTQAKADAVVEAAERLVIASLVRALAACATIEDENKRKRSVRYLLGLSETLEEE